MRQRTHKQGYLPDKGHWRNWYQPNGDEIFIAWRFNVPDSERRGEFETQEAAEDWLKAAA